MELATDFARGWPETFVVAIAAGHDVFGAGVCDDRDVLPSVLIVDDHAEFREAASALLEAAPVRGFIPKRALSGAALAALVG